MFDKAKGFSQDWLALNRQSGWEAFKAGAVACHPQRDTESCLLIRALPDMCTASDNVDLVGEISLYEVGVLDAGYTNAQLIDTRTEDLFLETQCKNARGIGYVGEVLSCTVLRYGGGATYVELWLPEGVDGAMVRTGVRSDASGDLHRFKAVTTSWDRRDKAVWAVLPEVEGDPLWVTELKQWVADKAATAWGDYVAKHGEPAVAPAELI